MQRIAGRNIEFQLAVQRLLRFSRSDIRDFLGWEHDGTNDEVRRGSDGGVHAYGLGLPVRSVQVRRLQVKRERLAQLRIQLGNLLVARE
ncbi:hypothetical protein D3C87_1867730 [compost metagenome]